MNVLIVDDQPLNRKLLRAQLEKDHRVIEAVDGTEALAILEHEKADAVISDILMPRMDGFTLCREIRQRAALRELPFIIYSSTYDSPTDVKLGNLVGADKFLSKPAPAPVVLAALEEVKQRPRAPQPGEPPGELLVMREYSAALVRKLEEKNQELAAKVQSLQAAQEELRQRTATFAEAEKKYRLIADTITEVFWIADVELKKVLYVNAAYEQVWGRSRARLLADPNAMFEGLYADDAPLVQQTFARQKTDGPFELEYRVVRPDGTIRWIWDRIFPAHADGGPVTHYVGVAQDITERKTAERHIRHQARLLDLARDSISECDLQDRIRYWNAGSERVYGWQPAEALGRTIQEVIQPIAGEFQQAKATVLQKDEWVGELRHKHKDGHTIVVNSRWTLLRDEHGEPKSILVINTDMSERKALEAQFFRAQRMEAIGTLASGIAHDLNNILAPIMMSAPILKWNLPPAEHDKILSTIEISAQRGADLVRQLLTFGRGVEGERGSIRPEALVREMVKIARQTFPKDIDVVGAVPEEGLWSVVGDRTQLHQVLLNLCVNARDAMPRGGRLTVGVENAVVDESFAGMMPDARPGDYVTIRVADTGEGIQPEIANKIFDPFFTTKDPGKGTGLGLATVAGIVKSHGGFINFQTGVGQGTTFHVYLPAVARTVKPQDEAAPQKPPGGQGELLLVVDDEENIRNIVGETLVRHGYKVITASDGAEATAHYAQLREKIAAVITDIDMPVMGGVTMIQVLKRLNPDLRVLVSSGLASSAQLEARRIELKPLGVESILVKPYTAEKILFAVHALLHPGKKTGL